MALLDEDASPGYTCPIARDEPAAQMQYSWAFTPLLPKSCDRY